MTGDRSATGGDPSVPTTLENRLMGRGVYVTDCRRSGDDLTIEYEVVDRHRQVTTNEVGTVVRTVLAIGNEREWVPGRVDATSTTTEGAVRGTWYVEAEWFDRLGIGLSDDEFSDRVLGTIDDGDGDADEMIG